jgi:hypothetical protein
VSEVRHPGELELRRRRAGELTSAGLVAIDEHVAVCPACRARLRALDDEQRRFEENISFDRFAAGVERAARTPALRVDGAGLCPAKSSREVQGTLPGFLSGRPAARAWIASALAMAACVAVVLTVRGPAPSTRIKGGAGMTVRVAGSAGQRNAAVDGLERLAPGERLRVGVQQGEHRYLLVLSIDDAGTVSSLYPESGSSLRVDGRDRAATTYLPDSLELTGAGTEVIVVVLSDDPIDVAASRQAAQDAYRRAKGDLRRLPRLDLPGEQFTRAFAKP